MGARLSARGATPQFSMAPPNKDGRIQHAKAIDLLCTENFFDCLYDVSTIINYVTIAFKAISRATFILDSQRNAQKIKFGVRESFRFGRKGERSRCDDPTQLA